MCNAYNSHFNIFNPMAKMQKKNLDMSPDETRTFEGFWPAGSLELQSIVFPIYF